MEKRITGEQFLLNQLTQALVTIKQLLDENGALKEQLEGKLDKSDNAPPLRVVEE